jgi:hypothetical protein
MTQSGHARRRFPSPWSIEELTERFVIKEADGHALASRTGRAAGYDGAGVLK